MFKGRRLLIVVVDIVCTDVVGDEGLNERQSFSLPLSLVQYNFFIYPSLFWRERRRKWRERKDEENLFRFYIPCDLHHCATRVSASVATACEDQYTLILLLYFVPSLLCFYFSLSISSLLSTMKKSSLVYICVCL